MTKSENQYLIEITTLGNTMKVTAIDPVTKLEAVAICPANLSTREGAKLAVQKLNYLLRKTKQ
jgi:hypothetical protein